MSKKTDSLYATPHKSIADFQFDQAVVDVFPDMIERSVPGYRLLINNISVLAKQYVQQGSNCYDLGCSLGEVSYAIEPHITQLGGQMIAVDSSQAMIAKAKILSEQSHRNIRWQCQDIRETALDNASIITLNFTLQFIQLADRAHLIQRIYQSLKPNGILILSEKVAMQHERDNAVLTELHHQFKRQNGYSELEVSQKRTALENVLMTESISAHQTRLRQAGFTQSIVWFQCYNFVSLLAIKSS